MNGISGHIIQPLNHSNNPIGYITIIKYSKFLHYKPDKWNLFQKIA